MFYTWRFFRLKENNMSTDIVFSFDTTGSMYPAIAELRRKVTETITRLFDTVPDLRIGLIAHGDYDDSPYSIKTVPLTNSKVELINFVNTVETTNGFGNGGEQYEKVMLTAATGFGWSADNRIYAMIGDEPAHPKGRTIHTYAYAKKMVVDIDWRDALKELDICKVTSYCVRCLDRSDSRMFHNEFAKRANTPLLHLHQFAHIVELITALTYRAVGVERVEEYANELQSGGRINRGIAAILDALMGRESTPIYTNPVTSELALVPPWRFQILHVDYETDIKSFVQSTGATFSKGRGFYELSKPEEVQERKEIVLAYPDGTMYTGAKAREMVGLPYGKRGKLYPNFKDFTVFVQSTSVNRKLVGNTKFLYDTQQ